MGLSHDATGHRFDPGRFDRHRRGPIAENLPDVERRTVPRYADTVLIDEAWVLPDSAGNAVGKAS